MILIISFSLMHFRPRQVEFGEDQLVPLDQLEEAWGEE